MRVTKTIKTYIAKRVNAVYQPKIDALRIEYDTQLKYFDTILDDLMAKAEKDAQDILAESGFTTSWNTRPIFSRSSIENTEWWDSIRTQMNDLRKERDNKIEEIIVTLELGGTKEELENMLNAII